MDARLRKYLEQPAPRPAFRHRHDDRKYLWLFPLGAAITFAMIFGGVFADDRASWPLGLALWATSVLVAALFAWKAHASTQAVFQNGTFTEARVVSTRVELGSEDQTLVVVFRVALADDRAGYRTAGEHHAEYSANLNERWIVEPNHYPFLRDAPFPVLVAPNRKFGKLYVNAEEIEVGRV